MMLIRSADKSIQYPPGFPVSHTAALSAKNNSAFGNTPDRIKNTGSGMTDQTISYIYVAFMPKYYMYDIFLTGK